MSYGLKKVGTFIILENYCATQKEQTDSTAIINEAITITTKRIYPSGVLIDSQEGTHDNLFRK